MAALLIAFSVVGFVIATYFTSVTYNWSRADARWIPAFCRLNEASCGSIVFTPRARVFGLEQAEPVNHSEEHLTIETDQADSFTVGDCCYAVPAHICPTVALHDIAWVVRDGCASQSWEIAARRRSLGV